MKNIFKKLRLFWPLIKSLQTGLLVTTGLAGYLTVSCPIYNLPQMTGLFFSLITAISGSTILNMYWDRDIDAKMERTKTRPLASGEIKPHEALWAGLVLSLLGVGLALAIDLLFGLIIFSGLFIDVVIYTMWLKRRDCWSIIWGGISGGMPILAGRLLGLGSLDWVGIMLSFGILFWIPTHILTLNLRYMDDYKAAGIPTFPSVYGEKTTRITIAVSSIFAAITMSSAAWGIGMAWGFLRLLGVLSIGLIILAVIMLFRPSERLNLGLFKFASLYMLSSVVLMMI